MDMYELRERYKAIPTLARCGVVSLVVLLAPIYMLVEESSVLEAQFAEKQQQEQDARIKFEHAKNKKRALPNEEQMLTSYQDNLRQARKMLPDDFQIDEILHATATQARHAGIDLDRFDPDDSIVTNTDQGIRMQRIGLKLGGSFHQVAQFLDLMLHLDKLIHFEQLSLKGAANDRGGKRSLEVTTAMTVYASSN